MATMASSELTSENDSPEKLQDRLKGKRRKTSGDKEGFAQYVRSDKEGFANRVESEAKRVSSTFAASGLDILGTIGYVYCRQAAKELGKKAMYVRRYVQSCKRLAFVIEGATIS
ncbi:hypothetical protein ACP70R_046061 [Stipagrostis hirtigluma subsp. patula]